MARLHAEGSRGFLTLARTAAVSAVVSAAALTGPAWAQSAPEVSDSAPVIGDAVEQPAVTPEPTQAPTIDAPAADPAADASQEGAAGDTQEAGPSAVDSPVQAGEGGTQTDPAGDVPATDQPATDGAVDTASEPAPAAQPAAPEQPATLVEVVEDASNRGMEFLVNGGPAIWAIAALSVVTVALILWKIWRLVLEGAWSRRTSRRAVQAWEEGDATLALTIVKDRKGVRSRLVTAAMRARLSLNEDAAREETSRIAKRLLGAQGSALRALELISTIAPLLGLLGTVMGMIAAFQALQAAGSNADPSLLAGGIWEALLTTAAGMAVAIPASMALTWFEAVVENLRMDMEDLSARIFVADLPGQGMGENVSKLAAQ